MDAVPKLVGVLPIGETVDATAVRILGDRRAIAALFHHFGHVPGGHGRPGRGFLGNMPEDTAIAGVAGISGSVYGRLIVGR